MRTTLFAFLLLPLLASCSSGSMPTQTEPGVSFAKGPFVTVTPDAATLTTEGATLQLTATTKNGKPVAWSSSDPNVAAVSASGLVTAIGGGTATVTASFGGHAASAAITVNFP